MGDTQSAQLDGKGDAVAEETVQVDDVQDDENTEDKLLPQNVQISELKGKAEDPPEEVNGLCEDRVDVDVCETNPGLVSPEEDVPDIPETVDTLKEEEGPHANVEIGEKGSPNASEAPKPTMSEAEAKMNEINESFKRFFTMVGVKLTVKKDSSEKVEEKADREASSAADIKDTTEETTSDNIEQHIDLSPEQQPSDNNSTSSRTTTDITVEEVQESSEETTDTAETIKEVPCDDRAKEPSPTISDEGETTPSQDEISEKASEAPEKTSPEEDAMSPIKRFFTTGIFSGLGKKKKEEEPPKEETVDKELVYIGNQDDPITPEGAGQEQEPTKEELSPEQNENEPKIEVLCTTSVMGTAETTDVPETNDNKENVPEEQSAPECSAVVISNEAELLSSQERVKIHGSPLRKLLSGTGLKKLKSKRQRGKKAAETKLTESGEHSAEQLESSTESAEYQKEICAYSPETEENAATTQVDSCHESEGDADGERKKDGTWASFKKRVTPKRHVRRPSHSDDEAVPASPQEEPQPGEGEEIINLSTEEHKKKMDSSAPWEAFLCGSGKKRSRKTSDSEDETPVNEAEGQRSADECRNIAESPLESSQEGDLEIVVSSPEQAGSPSDGGTSDGSSTWKSLKKLVTPKRKAKSEELGKDQIPSDSEMTKEDSSFSIKKLIPGRKRRKTDGKQEQMSSDEADRGAGSDDEHSDTPAVVPLSEFDMEPVEDHPLQSQAVIESPIPTELGDTQQDLSSQITDLVTASDILLPETERTDNNNAVEQLNLSTPVEEFVDLTEFITKHQQLSDIPEEGVIDESMATLMSMAEEINQDDTIAEDFTELTSEAFTALEPIEDTLADETEMVSAVSQMTESSKTSGNTTPIPVEQDIKVTGALLQEVVETICITPNPLAVTTEDVYLESIGVSVSPQVLETFTEQETIIIEVDAESDVLTTDEVHEADVAEALITTDNRREITEEFFEFQEADSIVTADEGPKETELQTEFISEIQDTDPAHVATMNSEESEVLVLSQVIAEDTLQPDTEMFNESNEPFWIQEANLIENIVEEEKENDFQNDEEDKALAKHDPVEEIITCQVEENTVSMPTIPIDTLQPGTEMFSESNEHLFIQEANLIEDIVEEEKQKEFQNAEDKALAKHDPVEEIITCQVEENTVSMPTIPIEAPLEVFEPLIDTVLPELQSPVEIEAVHILNQYYDTVLAGTAELDDVVIKNVPSVQCMDDHEIQVQVVDAEIESAEAVVETLLKVVSSDAVEVVDVCGKGEEAVQTLSATLEIEEDITEEASRVITQEINLQKIENQEVTVSPASEAEVHAIDICSQYAEGYTFDNVHTPTENILSSEKYLELESTSEVDKDRQERDLEENKAESKNLVAHIIPEESSVEKFAVARRRVEDTEEKTTQTAAQLVERSGNTGVVSSEINFGAPSSLTLEVKVNFQFGQTKVVEHASHHLPERIEPLKHSAVSQKQVQEMEEVHPIRPLQAVNTPNLQTGMTKPLKLTDVNANQESGLQEMKAVKPTRQVEEEIDQDVWQDAEENIYMQEVTRKSKTCKSQHAARGVESQEETMKPRNNDTETSITSIE